MTTATVSLTLQQPTDVDRGRLLATVFSFDRAIALGSGVGLIALSSVFARQFDWPVWVVAALGAALIPYGTFLHWVITHDRQAKAPGIATIGTDAAWVIASIVLIVTLSDNATQLAPWLLGAQALMIADVGIAKVIGLRKIRQHDEA